MLLDHSWYSPAEVAFHCGVTPRTVERCVILSAGTMRSISRTAPFEFEHAYGRVTPQGFDV
ncbi:hypothetical protein [Azospirillum palustre]